MTHQSDPRDVARDRVQALLGIIEDLPELELPIRRMAGLAARLGMARAERRPTLALRRHDVVTLQDTITLLEHLRALRSGGVSGVELEGTRDLLETRGRALEADMISAERAALTQLHPEVRADLAEARIDHEKAIRDIAGPGDRGAVPEEGADGVSDDTAALFADYTTADLDPEEANEAARRIDASPDLSRFTHDELIVLVRMRDTVRRIDGFGYGVAVRHRRLFSKARRSVLWAAPRVGLIMATHPITWRRNPDIGSLLLDLKRYDQHMRGFAEVPADDDFLDAGSPIVRAVRFDAARILERGLRIIAWAGEGPSAFRFPDRTFNRFPGPDLNMTADFLTAMSPVTNAMACAGIGGRGERDRALSADQRAEEEYHERSEMGVMEALRTFFARA